MWTRKELKTRGKASFLQNFWKTVLVSLILAIVAGGFSGAASGSNFSGLKIRHDYPTSETSESPDSENPEDTGLEEIAEIAGSEHPEIPAIAIAAFVIIGIIVALIVLAIVFAFQAFLANPVSVGCQRFFLINLNQKAEVREVGFAFDHSYMNIVKTCFFRDIRILLWGLLLIIPGVIKAYEYRMTAFILAEHPGMDARTALEKSRSMMNGHKWNTFVLDLSFIGWEILSLLTLGILEILYVSPYKNMTNAALYEKLAYGNHEDNTVWIEN